MTWEVKTIGSLGRIVTGKTPSSDYPDEFGEDFSFVTPSDMSFGVRMITTERFLSEKGKEKHKRILLPNKTTCVVCIGATIGKVCLTKGESFSNQQINSIVADQKENDTNFVYYFSTILRSTLEAYAGGAATPIVNKTAFSSVKIKIPDKNEQKKIAAVLSTYDDLIENNKRRIALLEKMAEEIYREWFVRFRFPGYQTAEFEKGIPKDWEVKKIGEMYKTSSGGTPSRANPRNYDGDINWLKTGELKNIFAFESEEKITQQGLESSSAKIFPANTIVIAMYCAMPDITILANDSATNQACCAFLPKHDYLSHIYTYYVIKFAQHHMIQFAHGAAQQNLSQELIKGFSLLMADENSIKKFTQYITPIFEEIQYLVKCNKNLTLTKESLLPRLISGKLSVSDLEIQFPPSMVDNAAA